jgi:hypothetical protein
MKTIQEVRNSFWEAHPQYKSYFRKKKRQNDYVTDIRCSFVDYVDYLHRNGEISDGLANKVTL